MAGYRVVSNTRCTFMVFFGALSPSPATTRGGVWGGCVCVWGGDLQVISKEHCGYKQVRQTQACTLSVSRSLSRSLSFSVSRSLSRSLSFSLSFSLPPPSLSCSPVLSLSLAPALALPFSLSFLRYSPVGLSATSDTDLDPVQRRRMAASNYKYETLSQMMARLGHDEIDVRQLRHHFGPVGVCVGVSLCGWGGGLCWSQRRDHFSRLSSSAPPQHRAHAC